VVLFTREEEYVVLCMYRGGEICRLVFNACVHARKKGYGVLCTRKEEGLCSLIHKGGRKWSLVCQRVLYKLSFFL
jgi:hypothetical protein